MCHPIEAQTIPTAPVPVAYAASPPVLPRSPAAVAARKQAFADRIEAARIKEAARVQARIEREERHRLNKQRREVERLERLTARKARHQFNRELAELEAPLDPSTAGRLYPNEPRGPNETPYGVQERKRRQELAERVERILDETGVNGILARRRAEDARRVASFEAVPDVSWVTQNEQAQAARAGRGGISMTEAKRGCQLMRREAAELQATRDGWEGARP